MEINNLDEEHSIKKIYNNKALRYNVKYNGKNVNKVPAFKHWINLMKTEKGEHGIICYCVNCHLFFYFENYREKNLFYHNNCSSHDMAEFCKYCGELYNDNSICCLKISWKLLKRDLYKSVQFDCVDYLLYTPFFSLIYYTANIFILFFRLRKKGEDINYRNDIIIEHKIIFILFLLTIFLYSLIFLLHYLSIYLFHLFFYIQIRAQRKKDINAHLMRY